MKNYEHPLWSHLYDVMHSNDSEDVGFYLREAQKAKGPVLEVACGTGRILLQLLKRGVDIWGLDISQPMLDRLRAKAKEMGLPPKVVQADMRDFSLPERFTLLIVPFRSFLHLETQDDQLAALLRFREHLLPDGRLILNFSSPNTCLWAGHDSGLRLGREFVDPTNGHLIKAWQAIRDEPLSQRQVIDWMLQEVDEGGRTLGTSHLSLCLRWISKAEFEQLLRSAGYSRWEVYGGFNGELLEREGQEMVWIVYP